MMFRSIRPVAAIMAVAIVAIVAGLAACGAAPGGGDAAPAIDAGPKLAAGTIPPDGPPKPGEATVGPDGMYDYAAVPHFKPMDPCVGPWREAASRAGFERRELDGRHIPFTMTPMCDLSLVNGDTITYLGDFRGRLDAERNGFEIIDKEQGPQSFYISFPDFGDGDSRVKICSSAIDLPTGSVRIASPYILQSNDLTKERCEKIVSQAMIDIMGELK